MDSKKLDISKIGEQKVICAHCSQPVLFEVLPLHEYFCNRVPSTTHTENSYSDIDEQLLTVFS